MGVRVVVRGFCMHVCMYACVLVSDGGMWREMGWDLEWVSGLDVGDPRLERRCDTRTSL